MKSLRERTVEAVNTRRVIGGAPSNLMMIRPVRHQWARQLLKDMLENTWVHTEVDLSPDAKEFATGMLSEREVAAFKRALAFLSNLDGIQLNNIANNINRYVTSPEINQCLVRQAWEEALHVESYATIIESIGFDPVEVYWMFERDEILAKKNASILRQSRLLGESYSDENFVRAVAANVALEGIYFYNGFLTFYGFARAGKMIQSAKMIKLIHKDERTHLRVFLNMWRSLREERPELFTIKVLNDCREILREAAEMEGTWGRYIIDGGLNGISDQVATGFPRYRADEMAALLELPKIFNTRNPAPWFDSFAGVNGDENFFEAKKSAYVVGLEW